MLPWGHAALGYLFYTVYTRLRYRRPPVGLAVIALGLGTQIPDLIDKPLAWHFSVLPSGRSLAHSLFTLALVVGVLWYVYDAPERRTLTAAFGVGWVSHLVGDGLSPALRGHWAGAGYVFWPVTSFPAEERDLSILTYLLNLDPTPQLLAGLVLTGLVFGVWVLDGAPGVADLLGGSKHR
jgi:hypothetical protein